MEEVEIQLPKPGPVPIDAAVAEEIAALADRQRRANGVVMKVIVFAGGQVEDGMKLLPASVRNQVEAAARRALQTSYDAAQISRDHAAVARIAGQVSTDRAHKVLAAISGALGGIGGLPTALAELPVATTVIFRAVQGVAEAHGEDPTAEETRIECLRVFGSGAPGEADDGVDTSFVGARLSLSGAAVHGLISRVAPKFAAVISQKLASQAVPVLGAVAGAGINASFTNYYVELAHVHFGLRRLARVHGEDAVLERFHAALLAKRIPFKEM
ncbi:EcsC family protein [Aestuariibius sp. 2305UL40-4]|uniref:EcsC family protein n=1 Tax=Aestuariibius violaceus TaxID=3234132 RepID=UPI00345F0044